MPDYSEAVERVADWLDEFAGAVEANPNLLESHDRYEDAESLLAHLAAAGANEPFGQVLSEREVLRAENERLQGKLAEAEADCMQIVGERNEAMGKLAAAGANESQCRVSLAPGQIYEKTNGEKLMYVRSESRPESDTPEHLFISADKRVVQEHWFIHEPDEAKLVNDVAGRAEAKLAWRVAKAKAEENKVLTEVLKAAVRMMDDRLANELRKIYKERIDKLEITARQRV